MTRDFFAPTRSPVYAPRCAVAASHPLAVAEAIAVLREGGNAIDAGLAAAAILCVAEPQMTGVGGDCFALLQTPQGDIKALDGCGWAPAGLNAGIFLREKNNPAHSVTVPGAVAAWCRLHSDFATMRLSRLFAPAMRYAEDGCPIAPRVARDWAASRYKLSRDPAARAVFLPGGQAPAAGEIHKQPALAETLGEIASGGRDAFYRGKITAEIVRRLRASGGKHTAADFAEYDAEYVRPICAGYRGVAVYECPPSSQGAIALLMLKIMRRFDWQKLSGGERAARFAAITKVAYKKRDALLADPRISGGGDISFWDDHTADKIADNIMSDKTPRLRRAASPPPIKKRGRGDTVYLCVADDKGYALSLICSLFERFGAALLAPRCGVLLHNRGLCFSASRKAGHPNACAPRKRPLHTIIPALAVGGGKRAMPFGVMGGDYQAAGHAQFLMNVLDLKMDPQQALDAPRLFFIAADGGAVEVEPGISAPMRAALVRRGFRVVAADDPIGGGQAIWRDDNSGVLIAASDPRKDGVAAGF